jgi:AraC-like DNA-binding protein
VPLGQKRLALSFPIQPRARRAISLVLLPNKRTEIQLCCRLRSGVHIRDGRDISLTAMAAAAGLERRTFLRRFANATGMTPIEYCRAVRIARARELLEFGTTRQKQIAQSLGYENVASFARVFRKVTGWAPGAYRKRFGVNALSPDHFSQQDVSTPKMRILEPNIQRG